MIVGLRKVFARISAVIVPISAVTCAPIALAAAPEAAWSIVIHPEDFVIGPALTQLHTRHTWTAIFDDNSGAFQVALRKKAVAIPAPQCGMDYLILEIPSYYPENPKQASVGERRAVYDQLVALQAHGRGTMTARVEAPNGLARIARGGVELTACNLYFALPLSVQVSTP
jgi:hypothetical protein